MNWVCRQTLHDLNVPENLFYLKTMLNIPLYVSVQWADIFKYSVQFK